MFICVKLYVLNRIESYFVDDFSKYLIHCIQEVLFIVVY